LKDTGVRQCSILAVAREAADAAADGQFEEIIGMSHIALEVAGTPQNRSDGTRAKATHSLIHGALTYRDARLNGYDSCGCGSDRASDVSVSLRGALFEFARPGMVVCTTPNAETRQVPAWPPVSFGTKIIFSGQDAEFGHGPMPRDMGIARSFARLVQKIHRLARHHKWGYSPDDDFDRARIVLRDSHRRFWLWQIVVCPQAFQADRGALVGLLPGLVSDDENSQEATKDAFDVLHYIASKRLAAGRLTVIDATSVQPEARKPLVELARAQHMLPVAIVFDLPEGVCQARNRDRNDRDFGPQVVSRQIQQLRRSMGALKREGFGAIHVLSTPEEVDAASIARRPMWNDLKQEHGPFDVGDITVVSMSCGVVRQLRANRS
jgi:predicted kinase